MNAPAESLLGERRRRVSLLDPLDPPDDAASFDEEGNLAEPEEEETEDE